MGPSALEGECTGQDHGKKMSLLREYIKEVLEMTPQIQPESQIFCDMDGVLVDFGSAVIALTNDLLAGGQLQGVKRTPAHFVRLRKLQDELGTDWQATTRPDLNLKVVRNFMFGAIGANPGPVFAGMPPWHDGVGELWAFLTSSGHTVNLLSAPITARSGAQMTAGEGKVLWAQEHLRPAPSDIIITPAVSKVQYATTGAVPNILIDDKASTVEAWNGAGGIGILHVPGGSAATIRRLEELGL